MLLLIASVLHSVLGLFGILLNVLLIGLVLFKTPKSIGTYSILIIVRAATDAFACFFDIFSQTRLIPSGLTLGIASSGFCKYLNSWSCFFGYSLQLQLHTFSIHLLVVSFAFRYYVLLERYPKANQILLVVIMVFFPSFFQSLFIVIDNSHPEEVRLLVNLHHPDYDLRDLVINGHSDIRHFATLFAYLLLFILVLPVWALCHILQRKIRAKLRNGVMRPEVREKHRQLTLALETQSILPKIYILSVLFFVLAQLKVVESPFLETCILFIPIIVPVFNPLIGIVLIRPYRESVMRWMGLDPKDWEFTKNSSVAPTDTSSTVFGSFDNSSVTSVSSAFTITETKHPFE
uniref:G_PROTEIN_RECEP_F1_2 domain-containing protein n=1 Tax=Caenorhabditis japonica TaxID=281687 RepID=A0A8R1DGQ5_CAEJA